MVTMRAAAAPVETTFSAEVQAIRSLIESGKFAEAESGARALLSRVEEDAGSDSSTAADVLDLLVEALYRGGGTASEETRALAERAVALKTQLYGAGDLRLATSLNNLGNLLYQRGDYPAARSYYEQVLELRRNALGPRHADTAKGMSNLAMVLRHEGKYQAAGELYEEALGILEEAFGPSHLNVARGLNSLAVLLDETGDYERARVLYERALLIREKALGPDDRLVAMSLTNLAVLLRNTGDYAGARRHYERALEILKTSLGPAHPDLAVIMNNLAELLVLTGDLQEARPLYEKALQIRRDALGPKNPAVATSLHDLAALLAREKEGTAARSLYEQALAISESSLGPDHPVVARTLGGLGLLLAEQGDTATAKSHLERALAIRERALGSDSPDVAQSLNDLANFLSASGNLPAAMPLLDRALDIRRNVLGPDHPLVAETLVDQAQLRWRSGDVAGAIAPALLAEEIATEHSRLTIRTLAERQALRFTSLRLSGLDVAVSLASLGTAQQGIADVWDAAIRSRALVLDEIAARHQVVLQAREVARLESRLQEARSRLANLTVRGPGEMRGDVYTALVSEVRREKERIERQLAERSALFGEGLSDIGLREIRRRLAPGTAVVGFVAHRVPEGARAYAAFVLPDRDADPRLVRIGDAGEIETLVRQWRREALAAATVSHASAKSLESEYRRTGEELRARIWDPVAHLVEDAALVLVIPDGAIHLVNLWALPRAQEGYLIESAPAIHYLSAERDIAGTGSGRSGGSGLLALGAPAFDGTVAANNTAQLRSVDPEARSAARCPDFGSLRFEALPGTALEVQDVLELWERSAGSRPSGGGATAPADRALLLTGAEASEQSFKRHAPGRTVLHLATHGFFLGDQCLFAGSARGIGSVAPTGTADAIHTEADSPLLLSGLVLAGANQRGATREADEDGVLTAEEIAGLDLSSAELVVLSACDTGLGDIQNGEGVLGLRRAFRIAGARTLIMSMWPVRDEETRTWMRALYRNRFERGRPASEAALQTSLETLQDLRTGGLSTHPFHWAGFIAVGEYDSQ